MECAIDGIQLPALMPDEYGPRALLSCAPPPFDAEGKSGPGHSQPWSLSSSTALSVTARPRSSSRKAACSVCYVNKERCDGGRPCSRCVRLRHTAHCMDRPSLLSKRQRTQPSTDAPRPSPFHLNDCVRPAWTLPPVDQDQLSRALLASHRRSLVKVDLSGDFNGAKELDLRGKLLEWVWHRQMLLPDDMAAVAHSLVSPQSSWYRHRHHLLSATLSSLSSHSSAALESCGVDEARPLPPVARCDGTMCGGFCVFFEALSAAAPCAFSWLRSPSTPIPDQPGFPNHAFCVIRRAHDEALSRYDDAVLPEIGLQVAAHLLASTDHHLSAARARIAGQWDAHRLSTSSLCDPIDCLPSQGQALRPRLASITPMHTIEVIMTVQANCALERLLGCSQSELRQAFVAHGERALYGLVQPDSWPQLMDLLKQVKWEQRREFRMQAACRTRDGTELPCILHSLNEFDSEGQLCTTFLSFLPVHDAAAHGN